MGSAGEPRPCICRHQPTTQPDSAAATPFCNAVAERAFRCSVCRALFSVPPPKGREGLLLKLLRGIGTVLVSGCRLHGSLA